MEEAPEKSEEHKDTEKNSLCMKDVDPISTSQQEEEEDTISEGSISEHVTSATPSVENDRSFQEIEIFNQPSALSKKTNLDNESLPDQKHYSLDLSSFGSNITNGLPDNMDKSLVHQSTNGEDGAKNVKSILEEILGNSEFNSDIESICSKEESFNIFANLDLNDKSLVQLSGNYNLSKNNSTECELPFNVDKDGSGNLSDVDNKLRQLEEIVAVKDSTITALSQELDSLREMSNYTSSLISATEYKQLQENCHSKLLEYNNAIIYKDDLIQQLSESLNQSVIERKELLAQVEDFKNQIAQLQQNLQETTQMVKDHDCSLAKSDIEVPDNCSFEKLQREVPSKIDNAEVQQNSVVLKLEAEVVDLQTKIESERREYETEVTRLKDLLEHMKQSSSVDLVEFKLDLEKKHGKEVEELRTYFEKKCADLEKNFSEEVFSQQSRKLSGSSSDVELSADFLLSSQSAPGTDQKKVFKSKEDVEKLKENLAAFVNKISKHSLECINDKELANIEQEVKNELNILFRIGEKLEIRAIENRYLEEISNLKFQLEEEIKRHGNISINSTIQEVANSGDYELNEVVESYERRLQEQITLAKIDIINSLEDQIQRLASNEADDEDWPSELLQLREKFTRKYDEEINNLREEHDKEITKLKDEHLKILNGALERARKRRDGDSLSKAEMETIKERDTLKKQVDSMRNLISELLIYFNQAEDELNNTLVENLVKQSNETLTLDQLEEELDKSSGTSINTRIAFDSLTVGKTRVHLTPNFGDLMCMIDHQSLQEGASLDVSIDLKNELGMCLEKLKQEANAILALTVETKAGSKTSSPCGEFEKKCESMSKQLHLERQRFDCLKDSILDSNEVIASLEKEKTCLENRVEQLLERLSILEGDLEQAKYRIAKLVEDRHSEVVSVGYGEAGNPIILGLEDTTLALVNLQEKARTILVQSRTSVDPNVLQLIEELCRVSEKVKEEAQKESRDLLQQIEVADKKYKTTQKFLEEQAVEREQERDEAQKKIDALHEQIKERDKDRANCQIMYREWEKPGQHQAKRGHSKLQVDAYKAEHLEQQIQALNNQLQDRQSKFKELESERDEAVEKIKILRDIITELEHLNDSKDREIEEQLRNVEKLECIVNEQNQSLDEYRVLTPLGNVSDIQNLRRHCEDLEEEVQKLRIGAELAGSEGALRQVKLQLFEIEVSLDKKTRELELLHSNGTNSCSSPSEDMSVRDLVRPQTPNTASMDECEVPLQQLARLKEKLLRHSRAEEAAVKRIQDLEMQVAGLKTEIEEVNNEKDVMKRQIQEQVVLISDFQIRLDQQRIIAEHIEKQTNTSLELRIYDLQNEIANLQEKIRSKDKTITLQEQIIKETQQRLKDAESEISNNKDDDLVIEMQKQLEALRLENQVLKEKPSTSDNQILPNLVENIIHDKNNDIERLRERLTEAERQLLTYTSLNLSKNDLKTLANLKSSGSSIEQLISILDLSQPMVDAVRRCETVRDDMSVVGHISLKKPEDTQFIPEISSIEKVDSMNYIMSTPLGKPNSTEISTHKSSEKRVRFGDLPDTEVLENQIQDLKLEVEGKNQIIQEMQTKLQILNEFEEKIGKLQMHLEETERALASATKTFEKEHEEAKENEQRLRVELAEKKLKISEFEKEVVGLKEDSVRKDDMYLTLTKEKRYLEQELINLKQENYDNLDHILQEKNIQLEKEQSKSCELQNRLIQSEKELKEKIELQDKLVHTIDDLKTEKNELESSLKVQREEVLKLKKDLDNKEVLIQQTVTELDVIKSDINAKNTELEKIKSTLIEQENTVSRLQSEITKKEDLVKDKECELDILNDDIKYYQTEVAEFEDKVKKLENPMKNNKQVQSEKLRISELTKEVANLQDVLREKDRVITQMSEDQNKLHLNMKVIDNKMKETGNIVDLSTRLKNEQKKNADLYMEIHKLKANLWNYEVANMTPVEEITGQLKKELECAAQIDSNILSVVSDQSLSSISEGHDAEVYTKALTRQKNQYKQLLRNYDRLEKQKLLLEQQCNKLEQKLEDMHDILEKKKITCKQSMLEDAKLLEQLRIQLDGALNYKEQVEKLLEEEQRCRRLLEIRCEELKKPASSSESTKYHSLPSENDIELSHLKIQLNAVKEEKGELVKKMKKMQQDKDELENDVKYTNELLTLEKERNSANDEKFRILSEKERVLSEELLKKRFELEAKDREVEEKKIKMDELEQEKSILKKQKLDLVKALKNQTTTVASGENLEVPETLANLIRELKQKSDENKKRLQQIERIEREKKLLENQLRNEVKSNMNGNMPFEDLVARCNYLFAKSLKLESVKKALIWQKRYLGDFLESHRKHCLIEVFPNQPHDNHCLGRRHSPINHFRAAVYAVMSIARMKFLVRRWHTGWRKYEKINARHYQRSRGLYFAENPGAAANFQVGQPVSTQNFSQKPFRVNNNVYRPDLDLPDDPRPASPALSVTSTVRDAPWSGKTPPSKENHRNNFEIGSHSTNAYVPLRAPQLLTQLHERVEQIQEKLSLPFSADNT
ncbi:putative leucine-rich repeat-containing protein DDB_G0290503 isoform X1 [Euwallacea fornicatus]|uniref:putative leucine-rich repeat-containing protein DDB_G0290503 isoform X1 n=1 Tax=Euwallacea fornicatus TaxID=995702 RepID=UPI00338F6433